MRVALVNCAVLPEPDPDEAPLLDALRRRGVDASTLAWDDPSADSGAFDACVLRATWNSHLRPADFLAWCEHVSAASRLINPLGLVRWNIDKAYLRDLERAGVPIVPTIWADAPAKAGALAAQLAERGWRDVVIKPRVGAGSYLTRRFTDVRTDDALQFLERAARQAGAMVQPLIRSVAAVGERSLIWIDGQITHAVRKRPRFDGQDESVEGPVEPTHAERSLAAAALATLAEQPTFARIDLFEAADGSPMLSELELIEPSLFFPQGPWACERLADAILGRR